MFPSRLSASSARKGVVIIVLVLGVLWFGAALAIAVLLGAAVSRADREELGSLNDWDIAEIDREVFGSR